MGEKGKLANNKDPKRNIVLNPEGSIVIDPSTLKNTSVNDLGNQVFADTGRVKIETISTGHHPIDHPYADRDESGDFIVRVTPKSSADAPFARKIAAEIQTAFDNHSDIPASTSHHRPLEVNMSPPTPDKGASPIELSVTDSAVHSTDSSGALFYLIAKETAEKRLPELEKQFPSSGRGVPAGPRSLFPTGAAEGSSERGGRR